ncbi:hypothetical protein [Hyphomicrobium sp.]|uniref:hypothetical protein n=1 Tax=Hyphomicrobium sp. TaxID=82 RepID=UPI002FE0BDC2
MTPFSLLIDRCGLSHREAAEVLGVRLDTVKSWSSGRNPTPASVVDELRALYATIERAAGELIKQADAFAKKHGDAAEISLELASSDDEARKRGWPCVAAQRAAYGLAIARSKAAFVLDGRLRNG